MSNKNEQYIASDGSKWEVGVEPIFYLMCYAHEDYDGAPDSGDHRCGFGKTREDCIERIEEYIEDQDDEPLDPQTVKDSGPNYLPDPDLDS